MTHAAAGPPDQVQDLYGVAGDRRLPEIELDWLPGYDGAQPARIGNAAANLPQVRAFGEVMAARLAARMAGLSGADDPWEPAELLDFLESRWRDPDCGIWEVRGARRQFVHSKVMVWAAADAAVKMMERFGDPGPADRWRRLRADVKADVMHRGYDTGLQTFVQQYDGTAVDASLLRLAQLGFLPACDARLQGTVAAIARELGQGGVLLRYAPDLDDPLDGLPPWESGYLPATCWLVQCLAAMGNEKEARRYFTGLLELRNDVGLLAEEYDPLRRRFAGNHPLLASHVGLAAAAAALQDAGERAASADPGPDWRGAGPPG
jgi:GH15 family glucan-1,4-alpha-glucosidase